ncbi:MAG TPA: phenylalanine--tRNA ligase subunit beta [Mycobacteriales bacterium]|nr:phenylalanine--tRNA ligase subunit beta [Mycobacteriales bacterium]
MRVPLSWLVEVVPQLADRSADEVAALLTGAGIEVEEIDGADITGPLVVGAVKEIAELAEFKKPIRFCQVDLGGDEPRGIVCGATNFAVGDHVVVSLPGAVLPGGFAIAARKTYGHVSDGMICSARELGLGEDHDGIMVLPADTEIGVDALDLLGLNDPVLVTEPTPDRGYQLSVRGIARELAALLDVDYADPGALEPSFATEAEKTADIGVVIDDAAGCDRFVARVIRGFDPAAPSPMWLRRRLESVGIRSISLAVDVTNYVMVALGQPMHAYDLGRLSSPITVRRAQPGEKLRTLDDVERTLDPDDLLITDAAGIQGLAGVMGGATSEVSPETTDLLLEAAHFSPQVVSRGVRRHALLSEAGRRFERGVDPALPPAAIELASRLLVEHGGGVAAESAVDAGTPRLPAAVPVGPAAIGRLVGVNYPVETVRHRLHQVGCTVSDGDGLLDVVPPPWRFDLRELADFAEEVARLEGYDQIPATLPLAPAGRGLTDRQRHRRTVSRSLAHGGFVETPSMSFQSAEMLDRLRVPDDDPRRRLVRLANPLSSEQGYLRSSLLPGLLTTLSRNVGRGLPDVAVFETGSVFAEPAEPRPVAALLDATTRPTPEELAVLDSALPLQREHVAIAAAGAAEPAGWWGPGRPVSWSDAVEAARLVATSVGVAVTVRPAGQAPWHPGRCAALEVDGTVLGHAGELHPAVCEALGLPKRSVAAELDLAAVLDASVTGTHAAPSVSAFPPASQDVALIVGADTAAGEVERALRAGAGELLEEVRLFDVYTGEQVGAGRKSLAYALRFRAPNRTLTAEEANGARDAAVAEAARRTGAVLRSG